MTASLNIWLAETGGIKGIDGGSIITYSAWPAGFDHASLVTAKRSRADGFDFALWYQGYGYLPLVSIRNPNTAACALSFVTYPYADIAPSGVDKLYWLMIGNLGAQVDPTVSTSATAPSGTPSVTAVASTLTLPNPGFPLSYDQLDDVAEAPYPEFRTPHRRSTNENRRKVYSLTWSNISPTDWYEIRAFLLAQRGGASSFTDTVAAFLPAGSYRIVPGSADFTQSSRGDFKASLQVEEVMV